MDEPAIVSDYIRIDSSRKGPIIAQRATFALMPLVRRKPMLTENVKYVEEMPGGGYRIAGTRIGLELVVLAYLDGQSPEMIRENFPSLSLEMIHGAIAVYLHHREEINSYLAGLTARYEELRRVSEEQNAPLLAKLRAARRDVSIK
jgi:uncharacterized protein (DUF433 family)